MKRFEKYLGERKGYEVDVGMELKKFDSNMKLVHTLWKKKKNTMKVHQLKKVNDALEKVAWYLDAK